MFFGFKKDPVPTSREGELINEYLIVGEAYECRKNKTKRRKDVVNKSKVGDFVTLEPFVFRNAIGYAVVSDRIHLDLGTISAGAAERLAKIEGAEYIGVLTERFDNSFKVKVYRKL